MTAMSLPPKDRGANRSAKESSGGLRVGHVYLDVRQRRLHCLNEAARQLHAEGVPFTPADLRRGHMQTPDDSAVTAEEMPLIRAWRTKEPTAAEFILPREHGLHWTVAWTATPIHGANGQVQGIVGTVTCGPPEPDLRKMAELAHDLRTPLQALRLLCAMVERFPQTDPELRKSLEAIYGAADRAVEIALELLDCCRGPAQRSGRDGDSWFALKPFLEGIANEQAVAANSKGLTLDTHLDVADGWEIKIDRVRLGRLLANLLVNAVRYTTLGRVEFTAAWREDPGGKVLALNIVDTGPGISQEEQDSIFQPFERGQAGKEGDSGGSGLGLAVVDRLVEELGLSLEVYSEYGRGSSFDLLVPAALLREGGAATR